MSGLKSGFEKYSKNNALLSILMVVLGLVLFLWPGKTLELASRILGIALLVGAVVSGVSWYRERHRASADYASLAIAILCAIGGIVVLVASKSLFNLLPRLVGILILINGVLNLTQALELRRVGSAGYASSLVMAVLTIVLGLFLLFFAQAIMNAAVMVIGGVLVYNGASNLWIESRYRKMGR